MTVKQLIEALANVDENLEVFAYDSTSEEWAGEFSVQALDKEEDGFPYVKADEPSHLPEKFVVLRGYQY